MKRRSFLRSTIAAGAFFVLPASRTAAGTNVLSTAVVLTDISAKSDPDTLLRFVQQLVDQGIWITCCVRPDVHEEDVPKLTDLLRALLSIGNGLDLAIEVPDLAGLSPYFQARAVFTAREQIQRAIDARTSFTPPLSVLCDDIEGPAKPTGVRASGLRNVLMRPKVDSVVRSEAWSDRVVRFFGGQWIGPQTEFTFNPSESGDESALIYYVSANDLTSVPIASLTSWAASLSKTLAALELNGRLALMTVSDLQLRDNFDTRRMVSVLLELPETATAAERAIAGGFREQLAELGIPSALKPSSDVVWVEPSAQGDRLIPVSVGCEDHGPSRIVTAWTVHPGYALSLRGDQHQVPGIDGCAVLRHPLTLVDLNLSSTLADGPMAEEQDQVLTLTIEQIASPRAQRQVLNLLQARTQDGITQFVSIGDFVAELYTDEPVAIRHRLTRAAIANAASQPKSALDDAERTRLLEDARHAWGYFETYQETATGLCPATVDTQSGGADIQRTVTMWDAGSNLNAVVAAVELGLIDRKQAETTFKRIFPNIAGRSTDGRLLPQGWIRTDRHRWGIRDFDGCDGGRLLSSLYNMRQRFGMAEEIEKLVASWNLDEIVVGGEIQSVIDRKFVSTYASHCAHYAALAFRRWGLDPVSPYETFANRSAGDGEMALLETVAAIGPMGTEPLLLEAMELGMSPESGYLAEVLLSAMEEEFITNNRLLCPSETPINHEPWFIYQGLELGSGPRSWRLDTVGHQPEYMTEAMADTLMTFSTKAAYLWAAYRPCAFTHKLLDFARRNGRNDIGFISGINVKTQQPMRHYADLNSNAIILQAIAHMLRPPN